jgi:DNA polymerase I
VIRRTINLPTYTLEAVYEAVFGKPKEKVYAEEIAQAWESGEGLERVARYSMEDAKVTYELGRVFSDGGPVISFNWPVPVGC